MWSQWLQTEVPDLGDFGTEITGVVGSPSTWRHRRRKSSSIKPKIVCKRCNNGWMSSLQERARPYLAPLFRGEETQLDAAAQQLVASWLTMTVMTAPWSNPTYGGGWAIPEAHRRELNGTGSPPQTAQVWIAPCSHDDRPPGIVARGIRYRLIRLDHIDVATPAGVVLPYRPGYAGALSIGNLASLIFGHTYDPIRQPQLYYDGLLGVALKQIWPAAETPLDWPRDFALNYTEFDRLISALEPWQ